ncbi:MAG: phage Gp37/Gp68 family protein [Pseudomonadota bacterium]
MADVTGISWTDHTFNPWWGCTAVAPGCDNCYAAAFDKRTGGDYWDPHVDPRLTGRDNWRKPIKWNKQAQKEKRRHRVFCGSMMDWCDKNAPPGALEALWALIRATPFLDWQLLTKRATLIQDRLPADWGAGYSNVWLGVTAEDCKHGRPRVEALRRVPARVRFVSAEPLLESITPLNLRGIHWLIIGGESGPGYRPMHPDWAYSLKEECRQQNVACWFKQWGGNTGDKGGCLIDGVEHKQWPGTAVRGVAYH